MAPISFGKRRNLFTWSDLRDKKFVDPYQTSRPIEKRLCGSRSRSILGVLIDCKVKEVEKSLEYAEVFSDL